MTFKCSQIFVEFCPLFSNMARSVCYKRGSFPKGSSSIYIDACAFCDRNDTDNEDYGQLHHGDHVTVHQNCMYFSSGLCQDNDTDAGILGFSESDIAAEVSRGRSHRKKCIGCSKKGLYVGCSIKRCRKAGHLPCVIKEEFLLQFYGRFKAYCPTHRPKQSFPPNTTTLKDCPICFSSLAPPPSRSSSSRSTSSSPKLPFSLLLTPCCNNILHRVCIQTQARSAGAHYFRCPVCNNQTQFIKTMLYMGIEIPVRDASWELCDQFSDLHYPPVHCNLPQCTSVYGRDRHAKDDEVHDCIWCGQCIGHYTCIQRYIDDTDVVMAMPGTPSMERHHICADCIPVYKRSTDHEDTPTNTSYNDSRVEESMECSTVQPDSEQCLPTGGVSHQLSESNCTKYIPPPCVTSTPNPNIHVVTTKEHEVYSNKISPKISTSNHLDNKNCTLKSPQTQSCGDERVNNCIINGATNTVPTIPRKQLSPAKRVNNNNDNNGDKTVQRQQSPVLTGTKRVNNEDINESSTIQQLSPILASTERVNIKDTDSVRQDSTEDESSQIITVLAGIKSVNNDDDDNMDTGRVLTPRKLSPLSVGAERVNNDSNKDTVQCSPITLQRSPPVLAGVKRVNNGNLEDIEREPVTTPQRPSPVSIHSKRVKNDTIDDTVQHPEAISTSSRQLSPRLLGTERVNNGSTDDNIVPVDTPCIASPPTQSPSYSSPHVSPSSSHVSLSSPHVSPLMSSSPSYLSSSPSYLSPYLPPPSPIPSPPSPILTPCSPCLSITPPQSMVSTPHMSQSSFHLSLSHSPPSLSSPYHASSLLELPSSPNSSSSCLYTVIDEFIHVPGEESVPVDTPDDHSVPDTVPSDESVPVNESVPVESVPVESVPVESVPGDDVSGDKCIPVYESLQDDVPVNNSEPVYVPVESAPGNVSDDKSVPVDIPDDECIPDNALSDEETLTGDELVPDIVPVNESVPDNVPVESIPVDSVPDNVPVESIPENVPIDSLPVQSIPVDSAPIDSIPVDSAPVDSVSVDESSAPLTVSVPLKLVKLVSSSPLPSSSSSGIRRSRRTLKGKRRLQKYPPKLIVKIPYNLLNITYITKISPPSVITVSSIPQEHLKESNGSENTTSGPMIHQYAPPTHHNEKLPTHHNEEEKENYPRRGKVIPITRSQGLPQFNVTLNQPHSNTVQIQSDSSKVQGQPRPRGRPRSKFALQPHSDIAQPRPRGRPRSKVTSQPHSDAAQPRPRGRPVSKNIQRPHSNTAQPRPRGRPFSNSARGRPHSNTTRRPHSDITTKGQPSSNSAKGRPHSNSVRGRPRSNAPRQQPDSNPTRERPRSNAANKPDPNTTQDHLSSNSDRWPEFGTNPSIRQPGSGTILLKNCRIVINKLKLPSSQTSAIINHPQSSTVS